MFKTIPIAILSSTELALGTVKCDISNEMSDLVSGGRQSCDTPWQGYYPNILFPSLSEL